VTVPRRAPAPAAGDPFAPRAAANNSEDMFEFDATGTTAGGNGFPVGVWPGQLEKVESTTASTGRPMFVWYFKGIGGRARGRAGRLYTVLFPGEPAKNWAAAQVCAALELGEIGQPIRFSRNDAPGRVCAVVVEEEAGRDGIIRPTIQRILHWSEFADDPDFVEAAGRLWPDQAAPVSRGVPA
jgi:hypothetical protein